MFRVTLDLKQDAKLRAYIKEMIKGQVLSIVRDEFKEMVQEEIQRKIENSNRDSFDDLLKQGTIEAMSNILYNEHNVGRYDNEFIGPYVREVLRTAIAQIDVKAVIEKSISDLAINLLKTKEQINNSIDDFWKSH